MIKSKKDLKYFISEDAKQYPPDRIGDSILERPKYMIKRYLYFLRKTEYAVNVLQERKSLVAAYGKILQVYYHYKMRKLSWKLGFQFAENVLGPGVKIYAYGTIIINANAKIGKNCVIYPGVTIGGKNVNEWPKIGDNCFIGLGAKVIGGLTIGDNVIVAPNSVVIRDVESNAIVGGIPAKRLK
mgnify:CR=1 FL=1|tara:strand:- start:16727 stop:17278 length:552 start_codon:yes stop_codon:yes gene_type:complete